MSEGGNKRASWMLLAGAGGLFVAGIAMPFLLTSTDLGAVIPPLLVLSMVGTILVLALQNRKRS